LAEFQTETLPDRLQCAHSGEIIPLQLQDGILQATFVFLRLAQFFERVMATEPSLNAEQRFHRHVRGLYDGMSELERHAQWTPRGSRLFESMCQVTERLKSVISRPDRSLYSHVGPDYGVREADSSMAG